MTQAPLRCHVCHDVIGAYEPVIEDANGSLRETSRAADAGLSRLGARYYHAACFASRSDGPDEKEPPASAGLRNE